jgi:hypothetical protein
MKLSMTICALCLIIAGLDLWMTLQALDSPHLANWPELRTKLTLDATLATLAVGAAALSIAMMLDARDRGRGQGSTGRAPAAVSEVASTKPYVASRRRSTLRRVRYLRLEAAAA